MVAFFGFFKHFEMRIQLFRCFKCVRINTSELLIFSITKPICTSNSCERKTIWINVRCRINVRSSTHIDKFEIFYLIAIQFRKIIKIFFFQKFLNFRIIFARFSFGSVDRKANRSRFEFFFIFEISALKSVDENIFKFFVHDFENFASLVV